MDTIEGWREPWMFGCNDGWRDDVGGGLAVLCNCRPRPARDSCQQVILS